MPKTYHVEVAGEETDHAIGYYSRQFHQQIAVVTNHGCTNNNISMATSPLPLLSTTAA